MDLFLSPSYCLSVYFPPTCPSISLLLFVCLFIPSYLPVCLCMCMCMCVCMCVCVSLCHISVWIGHPMEGMQPAIESALKTRTTQAPADPLLAKLEDALQATVAAELSSWAPRDLKKLMSTGKVSSSGCLEKQEFVQALANRLHVSISFTKL
jgi:hypothetical protein